jgi:cytochrome c-type biogenesis protein CcmH
MMFWGFALALTLVALALIIPPLWRGKDVNDKVSRDRLNAVIFKERLAELEAGGLSGEDLEKAKIELEKNLAQEIGEERGAELQVRARWAAILAALCVPLLAFGGYWLSSADSRLAQEKASHSAAMPGGAMPSLDEMIKGLRARLEKEPDNLEGWNMLARSYLVMERYAEANDAYEKMLQLSVRKDADILIDYAESLALANEENLLGKPQQLVAEGLALDPDHHKGLWLAGMAAMQEKNNAEVGRYWQRLLPQLPPDSEDYDFLVRALASVDQLPENITPTAAPSAPAAGAAEITVQVALDSALTAQAAPEDTLFVYARAATGSRAPLAIVSRQVKDLPLTVTLSDSMSMVEGMNLSAFPEIIVAARVSKSGNAISQSGDLLGESVALTLDDISAPVVVTITQVVE